MIQKTKNEVNPEIEETYPEQAAKFLEVSQGTKLDLTNTSLIVDVPNINLLSNEEYALVRKNGLGASDSSAVLGVSPFTSRAELIAEKARKTLTEEEKAVGELVNVRKGRELEPLIIQKFQKFFRQETYKPVDMYAIKDYPYLKINFDGVTGTPEQYIPAEIKVCTTYGEKHYRPELAFFSETEGFKPLREDVSKKNWSIETKAAHYGIPPYYYTQLQQQILGLNAPFGYLSVLMEKNWRFFAFQIWRDEAVINALIIEGYKVWEKVKALRGDI
jgi:predicted phage-related endonuclease